MIELLTPAVPKVTALLEEASKESVGLVLEDQADESGRQVAALER